MNSEKTKKPITDEIASVEKDIFRDYLGKVQINPDKILKSESGGKGVEIYEDLLRDDKVGSTLQTRRLAVTGKEWEVVPASDKRQDAKVADLVKEVLGNFNYDAARRVLLSGVVLGFKPGEVMWEYSEGSVWIRDIIGRASRRFVFDLQGNMRMLTMSNLVEGEELPDRKFLIFRNTSDNGSPYGDGLGRLLYWPVWFKKNAIKFWMIFADKFGSPVAIGKYPPGTPKEQQTALLDALEAIQQESAIKIPDTMVIELLEAARSGTIDTYEKLCNFMNSSIAQVMLGQTLTSEIGSTGSYAASKTHEEVREDYIKADADILCECQNNTLVRWIVDYNFPGVVKYPKVWVRCEEEKDLQPLAERDKIILVDMGMGKRVPETYLSETYGIPLAKEGEAVIDIPLPASPFDLGGVTPPLQSYSERCACGRTHNFMEDAWVQKYMAAIGPSLHSAKQSALNEIEAWLKAQSTPPSVEEFTARVQSILGSAYSSAIDATAVSDVVAELYTAQKIAGSVGIAFGGPDIRAMDFLSKLDNFYLSKWIQNPESVSAIKNFLSGHYLQDGAGLFGRTADESISAFKTLLDQKVGELADYQVRRIADTAVQRTRNWSHISQMNGAGLAEIEIIEPTQDCDFCKKMHGRIIQVNVAYNKMTELAGMSAEEYEAQFKDAQPTLDNLENMVAAGALPPYHPHCHGRIIKRLR